MALSILVVVLLQLNRILMMLYSSQGKIMPSDLKAIAHSI